MSSAQSLQDSTGETHFCGAAIPGRGLPSRISPLRVWRQDDQELRASLGYLRACPNNKIIRIGKGSCLVNLGNHPLNFQHKRPPTQLQDQLYSSYFSRVMLVQQFNSQSCSILFLEKGGTVSIAGFGMGNLSSTAGECPKQFKWEIDCCYFNQALTDSGVLASSITDMAEIFLSPGTLCGN